MTKVGEKVGPILAKDEVFRQKLNALVWDETLTIHAFEAGWANLMAVYGLSQHKWLGQLYEYRANWIPAYFYDIFMGWLLRTTSRSEFENSFFRSFTNRNSSLIELFYHYDIALDAQRHTQDKLNVQCESYTPEMKTPLSIECHAANVYTISIFYEVQIEIAVACFSCRAVSISKDGEYVCYEVSGDFGRVFSVCHNPNDNSTTCACRMFNRTGSCVGMCFMS